MIGMLLCSIWAWGSGKPAQLLIGWDSDQRGCGFSAATIDYPYLYWPEMPDNKTVSNIMSGNLNGSSSLLNYSVCVKVCPGTNYSVPVDCKNTNHTSASSKYANC